MSNIQFTNDLPLWPGLSAAIPMVIAQSNVDSTTGDAETINVTGSSIVVPKGYFCPGTTFRFTLAGARTGTGGAATVLINLGGTTVITIAIPSDTAIDWTAQFIISEHTDFAHQNCVGLVSANATTYLSTDYAAGTVNVSEEITIKAQLTLASASDSVTCSYVLVEAWKL